MVENVFAEIKTRLPAKLSISNKELRGIIALLSTKYLRFSSNNNIKPDNNVSIECELLPHQVMKISGRITNTEKRMLAGSNSVSYIAEIKLNRNEAIDNMPLQHYLGHHANRRKESRTSISIPVCLHHPVSYSGLKTNNISQKGIFITADFPFPNDSFVRLEMSPIDGGKIFADARIVQQISYERAIRIGREAGAGMEILNIDQNQKGMWEALLIKPDDPHN